MEVLFTNIQKTLEKLDRLSVDSYTSDNIDEIQFIDLYSKLLNICSIEPLKKTEDIPYTEDDFNGTADRGQSSLTFILRIFNKLVQLCTKQTIPYTEQTLLKVILDTVYTCLQYHNSDSYWSCVVCKELSQDIIKMAVILARCKNEEELLFGQDTVDSKCNSEERTSKPLFPSGIFKQLVLKNAENFKQKTWKQTPFYIDSYFWLINKIKGPQRALEYIQYFMPPSLFLLDDWERQHKIYGSEALTLLLCKSAYSDLRLYGRAAVIYDALKHQMYSRDDKLLLHIYPALIKSAAVLEGDPRLIGNTKANNYDIIMDHLLREMIHEQTLALRSVYIINLETLIVAMEIYSLRWTKEILDVCSAYMETYEGPLAQDRIKAIQILKKFVEFSWPRIHDHIACILQMICKVVYATSKVNADIDEKAVFTIRNESKELVNMLLAAAPNTVREKCINVNNISSDSAQLQAVKDVLSDVLIKV